MSTYNNVQYTWNNSSSLIERHTFFEYHEPKSKINQLLLDLPENYLTASSIQVSKNFILMPLIPRIK